VITHYSHQLCCRSCALPSIFTTFPPPTQNLNTSKPTNQPTPTRTHTCTRSPPHTPTRPPTCSSQSPSPHSACLTPWGCSRRSFPQCSTTRHPPCCRPRWERPRTARPRRCRSGCCRASPGFRTAGGGAPTPLCTGTRGWWSLGRWCSSRSTCCDGRSRWGGDGRREQGAGAVRLRSGAGTPLSIAAACATATATADAARPHQTTTKAATNTIART